MPHQNTVETLVDGQLAVAATLVDGQIISGRGDQTVEALVSTQQGNQLAVKALLVGGGGGGDLPDNVYTTDNLIAGTNISITQVPAPIIDQYTKALWNFEEGTNDVIAGYAPLPEGSMFGYAYRNVITPTRSNVYKFGEYSLNTAATSVGGHQAWDVTQAFTANGSFTLDFWLRTSSPSSYGAWPDIRITSLSSDTPWVSNNIFYTSDDGSYSAVGTGTSLNLRSQSPFPNNTNWHHIAIQLETATGNGALFLDGIKQVDYTSSKFTIDLTNNRRVYLALYAYNNWFYDEIRLSNIIRWTENFTPFDEPYTEGGTGVFQINNTQDISGKLDITTAASTYVPLTQKGAANGVATLDSNTLIPTAQLPTIDGGNANA